MSNVLLELGVESGYWLLFDLFSIISLIVIAKIDKIDHHGILRCPVWDNIFHNRLVILLSLGLQWRFLRGLLRGLMLAWQLYSVHFRVEGP